MPVALRVLLNRSREKVEAIFNAESWDDLYELDQVKWPPGSASASVSISDEKLIDTIVKKTRDATTTLVTRCSQNGLWFKPHVLERPPGDFRVCLPT